MFDFCIDKQMFAVYYNHIEQIFDYRYVLKDS